jgi:hypothetical protein
MKNRYYTAIKVNDEWERTDKRGYADLDFCRFNGEELAKRNGGQPVAILHGGKIIEMIPANPILQQLYSIVRGEENE